MGKPAAHLSSTGQALREKMKAFAIMFKRIFKNDNALAQELDKIIPGLSAIFYNLTMSEDVLGGLVGRFGKMQNLAGSCTTEAFKWFSREDGGKRGQGLVRAQLLLLFLALRLKKKKIQLTEKNLKDAVTETVVKEFVRKLFKNNDDLVQKVDIPCTTSKMKLQVRSFKTGTSRQSAVTAEEKAQKAKKALKPPWPSPRPPPPALCSAPPASGKSSRSFARHTRMPFPPPVDATPPLAARSSVLPFPFDLLIAFVSTTQKGPSTATILPRGGGNVTILQRSRGISHSPTLEPGTLRL